MSSDCIHRIHKWRPGACWRPNAETRRCRIRITGHRGNDYIKISVIPGSSLAGRNPAQLRNEEPRSWFQSRNDPAKGVRTKAQLVKR